MRVLHLVNRLDYGGVQKHVLDLVDGLLPHGVVSDIATWLPLGHPLYQRDGIVVLPLYNKNGNRKSIRGAFRSISVLRRLLSRQCYDIVHMHSRYATLLGAAAVQKRRSRRIYTVHNDFNNFRWLPWYPDTVIAPTTFIKESFLRNAGFSRSRIVHVIPHGISEITRMHENRETDAIFAYMGRMEKQKGPELPFEALSYFTDRASFTIEYYGSGSMEIALRKKAKRAESIATIQIHGHIDNPWSNLDSIRALLFPSVSLDALPYVVLEAFAAGVPVIASDLSQLRTLITHGETGLLFQSGNAASLAEQMRYALSHSVEMAAMGEKAREYVQREFSMNQMLLETLRVYREYSG